MSENTKNPPLWSTVIIAIFTIASIAISLAMLLPEVSITQEMDDGWFAFVRNINIGIFGIYALIRRNKDYYFAIFAIRFISDSLDVVGTIASGTFLPTGASFLIFVALSVYGMYKLHDFDVTD